MSGLFWYTGTTIAKIILIAGGTDGIGLAFQKESLCCYKKYPKPDVIAQMMTFLLSQPSLVEIRELLVHNR